MTELVDAPTATLSAGSLIPVRDAANAGLKKTTAMALAAYIGSGGDVWQTIDDFTIGASIANYDINIAGYTDVMVLLLDIVAATSGVRCVRFSVDNGGTYFSTSGNYNYLTSAGVKTADTGIAVHATNATAARSGVLNIRANNITTLPKIIETPNNSTFGVSLFTASNAPITNLRVYNSAGGNMTAGRIIVIGR